MNFILFVFSKLKINRFLRLKYVIHVVDILQVGMNVYLFVNNDPDRWIQWNNYIVVVVHIFSKLRNPFVDIVSTWIV